MVEINTLDEAYDNEEIHICPLNDSTQRAGIEIYLTDEENYKPYQSPYNAKASSNKASSDVENEESEDSESSDDEESVNDDYSSAYTLCLGDIVETFYYGDLFSLDFESEYKEMTASATFTKNHVNLKQFYKGKRLKLVTEWEEPDSSMEWSELGEAITGFITEQTFKEDEVEVKVNGMCMLMEQTLEFEFSQMYRADILKEILLSAGMNPIIDVTGLDNDITDFKNEMTNNNNGGSNSPIGPSSGNIAQLAQQICQGKTSDLAKAQAIHTYIQQHVDYPTPNYPGHKKCPTEVLRSGLSNCCDRARLGHEMANAVGLQNRGVHGPNHVWVQYYVDGSWQDSDPGYSRRSLGQVYQNMKMDSLWDFPSHGAC